MSVARAFFIFLNNEQNSLIHGWANVQSTNSNCNLTLESNDQVCGNSCAFWNFPTYTAHAN